MNPSAATLKRSGIVSPLFSVYSKKSIGIGDFSDLRLLVDWCHKTGNSILQFLPMNEVGPVFCPYDSVSSFALEPAYLCLDEISHDKKFAEETGNLRKLSPPGKPFVDYSIKEKKLKLLGTFFLQPQKQPGAAFEKFIAENSYWLEDFTLYKVLKEYHQGKAWYEWEKRYKEREGPALKDFLKNHEKETTFEKWLQYKLCVQFKQAREYAASKKILFKGDLPILVSRDSADVWAHPEFFKLDLVAGAPPDMYCAKGQRWGMSTYNWEKIAETGFSYLKQKLKYSQQFYNCLRIDHVVGLFRIWSIPFDEPMENKGLNGFFDPKDESVWKEHGRKILSVILNNTDMLLCAEDLGIIPRACTETLNELGIPGNDVQRWVKDWNVKHDFLKSQDYRELSVAMLSTHDTTNWPAWWENEAGTVDEDLFIRKCSDHRKIGYAAVKEKLFDTKLSRHGRLRWLNSIDSVEKLVKGLIPQGTVPKEHLGDFIDMYLNTYQEKEKLWKHLNLKGTMREKSDPEIDRAVLSITLNSKSRFCINTIFDWLFLDKSIIKGDPYQYRVNFPGTISDKNWSLTIPISLEELLKHRVTKEIRKMIESSGRICHSEFKKIAGCLETKGKLSKTLLEERAKDK